MDNVYTELRNSDDMCAIEKLLREYIKVGVSFVNLNNDSDDWYSFIIGDHMLRVLREDDRKESNYKYNLSELYIHTIVGGYNEVVPPEHSFENVDIKRFERVLNLLTKNNKDLFGTVLKILEIFKENGYKNVDFSSDFYADWPNSLALDNKNIIHISRDKNKIRLERLTEEFNSYNQKLVLDLKDFENNKYEEKIKKFISKFDSPDKVIDTIKNHSTELGDVVENISRYVNNHCMNLVSRVSSYGCESIFICGEHTVVVRYLSKGNEYNIGDFKSKNESYNIEHHIDNGELSYSVGDGFALSNNFKRLNGKALKELKDILNNKNGNNLCKMLEYMQGQATRRYHTNHDLYNDFNFMIGNITMESGVYFLINKREIKFKLNKSKIVIVYIDSIEVEELNFELNECLYSEAFNKIIDYVKN